MSQSESQFETERREKLAKLRELGVDPYGQRTEGVAALSEIRAMHSPEMGHDSGPLITAAGRVMLKRDMGKLSFLTLRDDTDDFQIALDKKRLDEKGWAINGLIDLGDLIIVQGKLGATKKGEPTIWASRVDFAAKSLLPPPSKEFVSESSGESRGGFADVEQRYRQRYVDLWANPEVMHLAKLRTRIVQEIRNYLTGLGYIEVETPMMQLIHGGAAARPFQTHHKALDIPLYLRIAPELFLKRLLVGGFRKVFEINRNFRNEGISPRHNPEFTMLEAYEAFGSWETMAEMVEGLVCHVAEKVFGTLRIVHHGGTEGTERTINLERPWRRVRMTELVEERTGWKFDKESLAKAPTSVSQRILTLYHDLIARGQLQQLQKGLPSERKAELDSMLQDTAQKLANDPTASWHTRLWTLSPAEQLQEVYEKLIEPTLIDPTFVTHVPSVIIPLARENQDDPFFADVYELAINGVEISPGYSELNDPEVQARHFAHQVGEAEEQQKVDQDFLTALKFGMPPAGGMGLGIDRLIMMLTGAPSIRDVILFPLMKPTGD